MTTRGTKKMRLTQRLVDRGLPTPTTGETTVMDETLPGFGVRVRAGGKATYVLRYVDRNKRDRRLTVGDARALPLDEARRLAQEHHVAIARGVNPTDERRRERRERVTVDELVEEVLDHLADQGRSPAYIQNCRQMARDHLSPRLGIYSVAEITRRDLDIAVRRLRGKPTTGNRLRGFLSRAFKLAIRWGYRDDDPSTGLERFEELPRERVLTDVEIGRLRSVLVRHRGEVQFEFITLLMLTGSRPKELLAMRWADLDLRRDGGVWTKPAQTTKTRRTHRVELSEEAVITLERIEAETWGRESEFVFPHRHDAGRTMHGAKPAWVTVVKEAGLGNARMYDLRRTVATRLIASGVDLTTVMRIGGWSRPDVLLRHYSHGLPGKQRAALEGLYDDDNDDNELETRPRT